MTRRTMALPLAALASVAILVAACGGGAATTAPGSGTPATQAPPTQAPITQAPAGTGQPTFALPSMHADTKLEDLFPKEIGGQTLTVLSMSGDQFMGAGSSPELDAAMGTLGKTAKDLSVAFGGASVGTTNITIIAFKVAGVPGSTILSALSTAYQDENQSTSSDVSFAGKSVKKFTPADTTEDISYIYVAQDVVFAVGGDGITDAQLTEVFSKLP